MPVQRKKKRLKREMPIYQQWLALEEGWVGCPGQKYKSYYLPQQQQRQWNWWAPITKEFRDRFSF